MSPANTSLIRIQDGVASNGHQTFTKCGAGKAYDETKATTVCSSGTECTIEECCLDCTTQNVAPFNATTKYKANLSATELTVDSVSIMVGMAVVGNDLGIGPNTRVTEVSAPNITLSKPTDATIKSGTVLNFELAACATELEGACATNLAGTTRADPTKLRCLVPYAGFFVDANGAAQPYFSTCGNTDGYNKPFSDAACTPGSIYDVGSFANSCEGTTCNAPSDVARCCKNANSGGHSGGNTGHCSSTQQECKKYVSPTACATYPGKNNMMACTTARGGNYVDNGFVRGEMCLYVDKNSSASTCAPALCHQLVHACG